ncbi:PREDICTED: pulmonary surfactant-associated protein A-like [Gekko japonicus]|uniref:Pulmonary surfactant-associated protein A-like n=1 Tax=Gekko japonicus TaxID=146911 RepID=A0ABM1KBV9_GEKJA|nr:PREDICTED: pulmonary surfactant-associated protein A-like [Gekko japonicus]
MTASSAYSVSAYEEPKLRNKLKELEHKITRLERALELNGRIIIVGDKLFATTEKMDYFDNTVKICRAAHGSIATPVNKMENDAIKSLVEESNTYAYLGITEGPVPGDFHFLNGAPLNYTNWYEGEPKGKGAERCVEMYLDGTWNDKMCNKYRLSVCEFSITPTHRP